MWVDVNHTLGRMQDELRSQLIAISSGQYLKYAHDIEHNLGGLVPILESDSYFSQ